MFFLRARGVIGGAGAILRYFAGLGPGLNIASLVSDSKSSTSKAVAPLDPLFLLFEVDDFTALLLSEVATSIIACPGLVCVLVASSSLITALVSECTSSGFGSRASLETAVGNADGVWLLVFFFPAFQGGTSP